MSEAMGRDTTGSPLSRAEPATMMKALMSILQSHGTRISKLQRDSDLTLAELADL